MSELTSIVDPTTGDLLVEGLVDQEAPALVGDLLPAARELYCAVPPALLDLPPATPDEIGSGTCVRIAGYYHNSLIEGPGRRSVVKFQGCPLHCRGFISSMIPPGGRPDVNGRPGGDQRWNCNPRPNQGWALT